MIWDNFSILEEIAPSHAAHARTCCEDFCEFRAGEMASEISEIIIIIIIIIIFFFVICLFFILLQTRYNTQKTRITNFSLQLIYNIPEGNKEKVAIYQTLLGVSYLKRETVLTINYLQELIYKTKKYYKIKSTGDQLNVANDRINFLLGI